MSGDKIHILPRENDGIVRGRIKVCGDVNVDISTTRHVSDVVDPAKVCYWLECAKFQIISSARDYESEEA